MIDSGHALPLSNTRVKLHFTVATVVLISHLALSVTGQNSDRLWCSRVHNITKCSATIDTLGPCLHSKQTHSSIPTVLSYKNTFRYVNCVTEQAEGYKPVLYACLKLCFPAPFTNRGQTIYHRRSLQIWYTCTNSFTNTTRHIQSCYIHVCMYMYIHTMYIYSIAIPSDYHVLYVNKLTWYVQHTNIQTHLISYNMNMLTCTCTHVFMLVYTIQPLHCMLYTLVLTTIIIDMGNTTIKRTLATAFMYIEQKDQH